MIAGKVKIIPILLLSSLLVFSLGCGPKPMIDTNLGSLKILEMGKKYLDEGKYKKARQYFYHLVSFYPGTEEASEGQYLLAKSYFDQNKYELSLLEFEMVIDRYPNSEYVDDAYYFIGWCYLNEAPDLQRDLTLVEVAIDNFETVILDFPLSNRLDEAKEGLLEARTILAKKEFYIAKFYLRSKEYRAAGIYFGDIVENYSETEYVDDSIFYLGECSQKDGDLEGAFEYYNQYVSSYPYGERIGEAKERLLDISENL